MPDPVGAETTTGPRERAARKSVRIASIGRRTEEGSPLRGEMATFAGIDALGLPEEDSRGEDLYLLEDGSQVA